MRGAIVSKRHIDTTDEIFAIDAGGKDAATNSCRILHADLIGCRVISKTNEVARPASRNTRINTEKLPADTESQNPFQPSAIKPARGTCIPSPTASAYKGRLSVHISRQYVGFD